MTFKPDQICYQLDFSETGDRFTVLFWTPLKQAIFGEKIYEFVNKKERRLEILKFLHLSAKFRILDKNRQHVELSFIRLCVRRLTFTHNVFVKHALSPQCSAEQCTFAIINTQARHVWVHLNQSRFGTGARCYNQ